MLIHISKIPHKTLLLEAEVSQLPQPLLVQHMLQSLIHLHISIRLITVSGAVTIALSPSLSIALFKDQGWTAAPLPAIVYW